MIFLKETNILTGIKQSIDNLLNAPKSVENMPETLRVISEILDDVIIYKTNGNRLLELRRSEYSDLMRQLCELLPDVSISSRVETGDESHGFYHALNRSTHKLTEQKASLREQLSDIVMKRNDHMPRPIPEADLEKYLIDRFSNPGIKVSKIRQVGGGYSKNIMAVNIDGLREDTSEFIIRMDVEASVSRSKTGEEYDLLSSIKDSEIPIPEIIFCEKDKRKLGKQLYMMKRAIGNPTGSVWLPNDQVTPEIGHDLARILARIHSIPVDTIKLSKPIAAGVTLRAHIQDSVDDFRQYFLSKRFQTDPLLKAGFLWLYQNIPQDDVKICLVQGSPHDLSETAR
jgi:hypothetical protein